MIQLKELGNEEAPVDAENLRTIPYRNSSTWKASLGIAMLLFFGSTNNPSGFTEKFWEL